MKIVISILGLLNGAYMLIDGIFVSIRGKYIGPEKPGPWAELFYKLNIDVFKLGWLFIIYGFLWFAWILALWTYRDWAWGYGILLSVMTLWYLPVGTLFSIIIMVVLMIWKQKLGL